MLTIALLDNRAALIPLLARWKLPEFNWLLPDEEEFPNKVGESLLGNMIPDYDGDKAFKQMQLELSQEGIEKEIFSAKRSWRIDSIQGSEKTWQALIDLLPKGIRDMIQSLGSQES